MKHHHQNIAIWYYCSGVYRLNICDAWHIHNYDWDALTDQVQSLLHFYSAKPCSQQIPAELLFIRLPKWIKIFLIPIVLLNCTVKMRNFVLFAHTYIYIYLRFYFCSLCFYLYLYYLYYNIYIFYLQWSLYFNSIQKMRNFVFFAFIYISIYLYSWSAGRICLLESIIAMNLASS